MKFNPKGFETATRKHFDGRGSSSNWCCFVEAIIKNIPWNSLSWQSTSNALSMETSASKARTSEFPDPCDAFACPPFRSSGPWRLCRFRFPDSSVVEPSVLARSYRTPVQRGPSKAGGMDADKGCREMKGCSVRRAHQSAGLSTRSLDRPLFFVFGWNSEGVIVTSRTRELGMMDGMVKVVSSSLFWQFVDIGTPKILRILFATRCNTPPQR